MTVAIRPQDTAASPPRTGALTVPIQIVQDARARHRTAVDAGWQTLPAWALIATTAFSMGLIVFAVLAWRDTASPLLIVLAVLGVIVAFTPDVAAALPDRDSSHDA